MCEYCTCRENDNTHMHGMRTKPYRSDYMDHQTDPNYTWTSAKVSNNSTPRGSEEVPAVGYGSTVGKEVSRPPTQGGVDEGSFTA